MKQKNETNALNKFLLYSAIAIVVFVIAFSLKGFVFAENNSKFSFTVNGDSANEKNAYYTDNSVQNTGNNAQYQEVRLIVNNNYEYEMIPSTLKQGVPVRLIVDTNTVVGCARAFTIPAFNVRKYVSEKDNIIEFTPLKSGTFNMACTMNMYRGTFTVSSSDVQGSVQTASQENELPLNNGNTNVNGNNLNYGDENNNVASNQFGKNSVASCGMGGAGGCGCGAAKAI